MLVSGNKKRDPQEYDKMMGMGSQSLWIWALTLFFTMKKYGAIIDRLQLGDDGGGWGIFVHGVPFVPRIRVSIPC